MSYISLNLIVTLLKGDTMKFGIARYHDIEWELLAKIPCSFCGSFNIVDDGQHPRCQQDNCNDGQDGDDSA
jgi:hypothetical protein